MEEQIPLVDPTIQPVDPRTPTLDCYLVVAYRMAGEHWKVFPEQWLTQNAAWKAAKALHRGFAYQHIVHVVIDPTKTSTDSDSLVAAIDCDDYDEYDGY